MKYEFWNNQAVDLPSGKFLTAQQVLEEYPIFRRNRVVLEMEGTIMKGYDTLAFLVDQFGLDENDTDENLIKAITEGYARMRNGQYNDIEELLTLMEVDGDVDG